MNRTPVENTEEQENWRRSLGRVQLRCPYCDAWFTLGKDFKIDENGNVNRTAYHFCPDDDMDMPGYVILAQLVGWKP